jgi:CheY-like chemotaxis protein
LLPALAAQTSANGAFDAPLDPASAAPRLPVQRIVLVEDNESVRRLLTSLLGLEGHIVEVSGDGPRGVEVIRRLRPDIALVDIGLPGCDGYQVAAQVRADPACRRVRLVAMTGYGQPDDRRRALDAGFDAHLVKPFQVEDLNRLLAGEPAAAVAETA